jgi:hypothetical protein
MLPAMSTRTKWMGTDLLVAGAEAVAEQVDVVALLARRLQERSVRHEHGRGEVVGQQHPRQRPRRVAGQERVGSVAVERRLLGLEADLVGQVEVARAPAQHLGEVEHPLFGIEAPDGVPHVGGALDPDLDSVGPLELLLEPLLQVVATRPRVPPELLGPLLHLGEVVAVALDEVGDLLGGHARRIDTRQVPAPGDLDGQVVGRLPGLAKRVVELQDPARGGGRVGGQVAHLDGGHVLVVEDGIPEYLHELGDGAGVLLGGERLQVELEDRGDLDEQGRGHGAAIVLDEVQVGGRDAQPVGKLHLADALLAAHRPDLGSEQGGFSRRHGVARLLRQA